MIFEELKVNNRVQIESENEDPSIRNIKGIILGINIDSIIVVTDYGKLYEVEKNKVLSINKINFDRIVSEALIDLKNYFTDIYELEMRLKELKESESSYVDKLYDANFLSKFNIIGASNRIVNSIDESLLRFSRDSYSFRVYFRSNPDNQIEMCITVLNTFEYYNLDEICDVDKIIQVHAPNIMDNLKKVFDFSSQIEELQKKVIHEKDNFYSVSTDYVVKIDVTHKNFVEVRSKISKGLNSLKK